MMPHLILEYSNNIHNIDSFNHLFDQLHHLLAEELPTQLSSCKSRCIAHSLFFIGDQNENNAFAHLTIKILSGRTDSKKRQTAEKTLNLLDTFFNANESKLKISLSVEILDIDTVYFKN